MKKICLALGLSVSLIYSLGAQDAASNSHRQMLPGGLMGFGVRTLFLDTGYWNSVIPDSSLPALPAGPALMHGGFVYVDVTDWFRAGLQGWGLVHGTYLDTSLTEFAGAMVGTFAEARYQLPWV